MLVVGRGALPRSACKFWVAVERVSGPELYRFLKECNRVPKRPRNHELETESQRAFENAVHPSMVVRPVPDDYGIDREVELFEDGSTTGLTFKVQLKSTDKSGTKLRVSRDHLNYWRSLDVPVLLVSFESKSSLLRTRWVHSIGIDMPDNGAKKLTVHMEIAGSKLLMQPELMINDLRALRGLNRGEIPDRVPVLFRISEQLPLDQVAILTALLVRSRSTGRPLVEAESSNSSALDIFWDKSRITVSLPLSFSSCTIHVSVDNLPSTGPREIAELLLLMCSAAVVPVSETAATQWLLGIRPDSPWWQLDELSERLLSALTSDQASNFAFDIYVAHLAHGIQIPGWIDFAAFKAIRTVSDEKFYEVMSPIETDLPSGREGGRLAYNLAFVHRSRSDYEGALKLFDVAKSKNSFYATDSLYLKSVAACLWEDGRHSDAAEAYGSAIDNGADAHAVLPLLADSFMHAGDYASALDSLENWHPNGTRSDKAGTLRLLILNHIQQHLGIQMQDRRPSQILDLNPDDSSYTADQFGREIAFSFLREDDALSPQAWLILATLEPDTHGFIGSLIAALITLNEPSLWLLAATASVSDEQPQIVTQTVMDQARFLCGEAFYDAVVDLATDSSEISDTLLRLAHRQFAEDPETATTTMRMVDTDAPEWVMETLQIGEDRF